MIQASGLVKAFGLRPVLRGISFTVERGTLASLLGVNGSGKTTLMRILAGLSNPTAGSVTIGGWSLPKEASAVRAQLGVVAHLPLLYDDLTASENLRFFGQLYGIPNATDRIAAVLNRVDLGKRSGDLVRSFSRGMQQRLGIARAILHDPAVLLLDEPYTGLDVKGAEMLDGLLREWKTTGRTVIMTSHDLERAKTFSDQVLIIHQGKLAADTATATIDNLPEFFAQLIV
jgi:heme exporter protein A